MTWNETVGDSNGGGGWEGGSKLWCCEHASKSESVSRQVQRLCQAYLSVV